MSRFDDLGVGNWGDTLVGNISPENLPIKPDVLQSPGNLPAKKDVDEKERTVEIDDLNTAS